ncbi:hypothetical protein AV530_005022 [Patagioenas fasciata monilis]|uniref:Uncharacterized protein n=1 Tax=Patagioenas fasciata monilis TaxID=372326 RepID=A0A1V4K400_PATFA|nr:hypothetical protein AV530_005022 [Patagioenas fasciata monilis]
MDSVQSHGASRSHLEGVVNSLCLPCPQHNWGKEQVACQAHKDWNKCNEYNSWLSKRKAIKSPWKQNNV